MVFLGVSVVVMVSLFRRQGDRRYFLLFCVLWIVAVAAALGWLTYLLGDARLLVEYPRKTAAFLLISPYSNAYESGTVVDLIRGFWIVSPLATLCFPLGLFAVLRPSGFLVFNRKFVAGLGSFVLVLLAASLVVPHHLNFRYICPSFGPFYLVAGVGFCWAAAGIAYRLRRMEWRVFFAAAVVVVTISSVSDYATFQKRFVATGLADLSIRMVEMGRNE
jgi:hypothetical protein